VKRKSVYDQNGENKPFFDGVAQVFLLASNDHGSFRIKE